MSDDRISSTPRTSRCPVCDGATATTPDAACPACGRTFASPSPLPVPDLRRRLPPGWFGGYDKPAYGAIGIFVLLVVGIFAFLAPGVLVLLALFLVPAGIRTIRLATRPEAREAESFGAYLVGALLASFGVAVVAGAAGGVAAGAICAGTLLVKDTLETLIFACVAGNLVGLFVFIFLFVKLWLRESDYDKIRRSPDPEE